MNERLNKIYKRLLGREYRNERDFTEYELAEDFAARKLSWARRSAERLKFLAERETPRLEKHERIGFMRSVAHIPSLLTENEELARESEHYVFDNGGVGNISSDYGRIIGAGFERVRSDIERALRTFRDGSAERDEAESMLICIDAVYILSDKYRACAEKTGCAELATALSRVPRQSASSYYEGLVFLRLLNFMLWLNGNKHNTLGRFDVYMGELYARDMARGVITREQAKELTEEFFISLNFDADLYPGIQQGDNGQSLMLGGLDRDGKYRFDDLCALCLEASLDLGLIDPKINVRVCSETPDEVYRLGTRLTKRGLGFPQYSNDDVVIPALIKLGYDEADVYDYTVAACWEFIIPGKGMDIPNIDAVSFPAAVNEALAQVGDTDGFEDLYRLTERAVERAVEKIAEETRNISVLPSPFQSILMDGCIESGRDIAYGNKYNNYGVHGAGLANAADALASLKKNVYEDKTVDLATVKKALAADFVGYAAERKLMFDAPKTGNNDDRADVLLIRLIHSFSTACSHHINERGGIFRAGTGTAMYYVWLSENLGATADGRKRGEPFAANYSPSLGIVTDGVLSVVKSFTKPDLTECCNGGPLTLEFHDTVFRNESGINKVATLVKTFILMRGHQLQLNAVNRDALIDAQRHPEAHPNMIVRVWGWSGYFNELSKEYQDHVIKRLEYLG